jgi:plasmid stability protein
MADKTHKYSVLGWIHVSFDLVVDASSEDEAQDKVRAMLETEAGTDTVIAATTPSLVGVYNPQGCDIGVLAAERTWEEER